MEIIYTLANLFLNKNNKGLIFSIISIFLVYVIRKYCNRPKTYLKPNVSAKIIIFTGSSDGIGKEAALQLVKDGAIVIFACRNKEKTLAVINEIHDEKLKKNAIFMELNLSSFESVKKFVKEFKSKFQRLDILVNNAAIVLQNYTLTEDNIESTLQTNTFSPMILTQSLKDLIQKLTIASCQ